MSSINDKKIKVCKSELNKTQIRFSKKQNGREVLDFLIGENQLYFQSIDIKTSQLILKL